MRSSSGCARRIGTTLRRRALATGAPRAGRRRHVSRSRVRALKKKIRVHTPQHFAIGDIDKVLHGKTESRSARRLRDGVEDMADRSIRACRDQLHHEAVLPVEWAARAGDEDPALVARRLRRNMAALAVDAAGDERRERPSEDGAANVDLQRIDSKLNAIMELFALVLERGLIVPARVPLRFNAHGIEWQASEAPPAGQP